MCIRDRPVTACAGHPRIGRDSGPAAERRAHSSQNPPPPPRPKHPGSRGVLRAPLGRGRIWPVETHLPAIRAPGIRPPAERGARSPDHRCHTSPEERRNDPTAHAEMLVLRDAAAVLGGWRIPGATVYVTLEPCPMCAGALVLARIDRLVFGARDPKSGAAGTVMDLTADPALNHRIGVTSGVGEKEAAEILQEFFGSRR